MFSNPITGRAYIFTGHTPGEEEATTPDPGLTIVTVIFCIVGPFWLIFKLVEQVAKKVGLVSGRTMKLTE